MSYILWFDEVGAEHVGQVGGKGANLGEMQAAGMPVPPGFCVTARAYQDFLEAEELQQEIGLTLAELDPEAPGDLGTKSQAIRQRMLRAEMPPAVRRSILDSYTRLAELVGSERPPVAVRSSATAEDLPTASFAGQQDTYLNIRGEAALLEHVQRCWASLWTERAMSYRIQHGFDHRLVQICVVVQAMIEAEIAGIMFTANPVSGNRHQAVINASWGLGEAIVSGLVTPDTLIVDKRTGAVLDRQVGDKQLAIHYDADGGVSEVQVAEQLRQVEALSDDQAGQLAALGAAIEAHYAAPQDIEWGYCAGRWYILQARPITTLAEQVEAEADEYNRTMFLDIFPDPLSPVFLEVIQRLFHSMLDFTFQALGFDPTQDRPAVGSFYNQPYFNRNYIDQALNPLSERVREPLVDQITNPFGRGEGRVSGEMSLAYLNMAARSLNFMVSFPKQLPGLLQRYRSRIRALEQLPLEGTSDSEIVAQVERLVYEDVSQLLNYDFLMIAMIGRTYETLGTLLERSFGEETDELRAKLISGVTGNVTMETNKRLWDLAQLAKASAEVSAILRRAAPSEVRAQLEAEPAAQDFLMALDGFLAEYGHREIRMDILYPTWGEDPAPVFGFIRGYLDSEESQSPHRQQERLVRERRELSERALRGVERGILGRLVLSPIFRWVLKQTLIHTRERDTMHFELTRLFPPVRRLLKELGRRWSQRGLLGVAEDIYFLTLPEMATMDRQPQPAHQLIVDRRQEFEASKSIAWPDIVRGAQEIHLRGQPDAGAIEGDLSGIAGSPGVVTGAARVIRGPEEFDRLQRGEVLVAPITNPVWTPLFAIAGGVITEVGGILSHGAIVAREYGIPAVMSVPGATTLLTDGQLITVDGNRGTVQLRPATT